MSIYNVSVIPQNLRRDETIVQIAESLNYLLDITNDIFKRVNNRLELNTQSLNKLQERIDTVNNKISNLSVAKKAIQVFSSSKYPAAEVRRPYETIFTPDNCPTKTRFPTNYNDYQIKEEPLEKLQFFHITSNYNEKPKSDGLGGLPTEIESVNDFLLYNSGKNPYIEYVLSDTLQLSQISKKQNISERHEIEAAPFSITERTALMKVPGENYFYSPDLGDVPTIDVPIDLPDLPGIADDLRYTDETGPGIAPSVTTTPNIPNLPQFETETPKIEPLVKQDVYVKELPIEVHKEQPKFEDTLPIPEDITLLSENELNVSKNEQESRLPPVEPEIKKPILEITDVHANLMDAIRKAGGLKNAKLRSIETKEGSSKKNVGGDLMAEFHAKLSLRRKGISGNKKFNEWDAGSAMERISEMLRPPPAKTEQSESATTDEDWD